MAEENYKKSGSSGKKSSIGGQTPGNSNPSGIGAVAGTAAALLPMLLGGIRNKQGSTAGNSPMARHTGEDHGGEVSTLQPSIADPAGGEKVPSALLLCNQLQFNDIDIRSVFVYSFCIASHECAQRAGSGGGVSPGCTSEGADDHVLQGLPGSRAEVRAV